MRVAFVTTMTGYPWGGSEELWYRTALRLKEEGHDVLASVLHWPKLSENVLRMKEKGIRLQLRRSPYGPPASRIWRKVSRHRIRCYWEIERFNPDLVVICQGHNDGGFDWADICQKARIPYAVIIQCNSETFWFGDRLDAAVKTYSNAKGIFCVSRGNLELLRMQVGHPLPNAEVVWNPWNVSQEAPPKWPSNENGWRLASVARLEPSAKGQDLLLKTLALPEWRVRPVQLNLYGAGPDEQSLRRFAEMLELKNVNFRGHVKSVRTIWEENHLLVLASRFEGLPLALVESMWCGRPAVVTDVAGNTEVCVDNETGFVAPAPTVPLLAGALERAWERRGDWQRMGQAARGRAESIIPKDPIALFADKLRSCAVKTSEVPASANPSREPREDLSML
ncbi:MAG TPA: glycosyltransferase family 4 protein [Terracidiphilus sp.]|nr:glycosyltransferase family 4 protein [Terracidiphilus sp.]